MCSKVSSIFILAFVSTYRMHIVSGNVVCFNIYTLEGYGANKHCYHIYSTVFYFLYDDCVWLSAELVFKTRQLFLEGRSSTMGFFLLWVVTAEARLV